MAWTTVIESVTAQRGGATEVVAVLTDGARKERIVTRVSQPTVEALKAMRSRDVEPEVWKAIERLDDETRQRLLARLQQIHANAPAVAREYVTRGLG